jgi:hypothetical protein
VHVSQIEITSQETDLKDIDIQPDTIENRYGEFLMYVDFVEYYVSAVIGLRHFEKYKCTKKYRDYVTISDEAFAILTIENNWDRWMDMAENNIWKTSAVPTKWTVTRDKTASAGRSGNLTQGRDALPQARRYRGWSAQGILRYNQLFDEISAIRTQPRASLFEDRLLKHFQHEAESKGKSRKKITKEPPPLPTARHQLWALTTITTSNGKKQRIENINALPGIDDSDNDRIGDTDDEDEDQLPSYSL